MNPTVRFGWFTWDGEKAVSTRHGNPLPAVWQRIHYRGDVEGSAGLRREGDSYEGLLPLENGCSAWLFGELNDGLWEITMALYAPCPIHPNHEEGVRHCEFWAVPFGEGAVTQPSGCQGFFCPGCWHHKNVIVADPGDEPEFWETMRAWSSLEVVHNPEIAEHDEAYKESGEKHGFT